MMPDCCPGFCTSFNWIHECMGSCICVYVCVIKLMRSCKYVYLACTGTETSRMALPYTCMEIFLAAASFALGMESLHDLQKLAEKSAVSLLVSMSKHDLSSTEKVAQL